MGSSIVRSCISRPATAGIRLLACLFAVGVSIAMSDGQAGAQVSPKSKALLLGQYEYSASSVIVINKEFYLDFVLSHKTGEQGVGWSAVVHKSGLTQPGENYLVELRGIDDRGRKIVSTATALRGMTDLHGKMSLRNYCSLAFGSKLVVHLAELDDNDKEVWSVTTFRTKLLSELSRWPSCSSR
ncbi:MAG: hypothetical protein P4L98_19720 [Ancalomicrobiaceae bacterium]|nr:hypothetical protein [Ancalomicrobiaceae bacterium]